MRGVKYDLLFLLPNGTTTELKELSSIDLRQKLTHLFQEHYHYEYYPTADSINNLNTRPDYINRFVRGRVSVSRCVKEKKEDD